MITHSQLIATILYDTLDQCLINAGPTKADVSPEVYQQLVPFVLQVAHGENIRKCTSSAPRTACESRPIQQMRDVGPISV